ncbi:MULTISPECIES: hypothetical protein [Pseudomonas]|nr:hypothetical protein [Pseudomonas sp. MYb187]
MVPLRLLWLIWDVFPECLAEFIQYNVPYTTFPLNGKIVDR